VRRSGKGPSEKLARGEGGECPKEGEEEPKDRLPMRSIVR